MKDRNIETFEEEWEGIRLRITYEANWLSSTSHLTAHLQVESIEPVKAALPISETGYRSHFCHQDSIDAQGGAVAYVMAWLEVEGETSLWKSRSEANHQLSLF